MALGVGAAEDDGVAATTLGLGEIDGVAATTLGLGEIDGVAATTLGLGEVEGDLTAIGVKPAVQAASCPAATPQSTATIVVFGLNGVILVDTITFADSRTVS